MSSNKPLVSIITPAFNCEDTIAHTYQSIKAQTYSNWEWLITDDCSGDDTCKIVESLIVSDERIKLFKNNENSGAAVSRNNSIVNSKGRYIAFIDSDDLWFKDKLSVQLKHMETNSYDFSFTAYNIVDANGKSLNKTVDSKQLQPLDYYDMLKKKATLGCSTVMLKKESFTDLMMPLIRTGQDYALWLKLLRTGVSAHPINDVLTSYRVLPNSISRNKLRKAKRQWQIYREIEGLPLIYSLYCFYFYGYRAVFRK
ncbi:glycosyltransferase family 2 protein [Vibrio cyclitrophicus]